MRSRQQAFTLIEILISFAIIILLLALLFPVLASTHEHSRVTTCLSNLHQQGGSISLYTSDYDGQYPFGLDSVTFQTHTGMWFDKPYKQVADQMGDVSQLLTPYLYSKEVFRCPAEHKINEGDESRGLFAVYGSSYSYNSCAAILHRTDSVFVSPSTSYLMADWDFWHGGTSYLDGRINNLFVDNHVKNITWTSYLETTQNSPCVLHYP